MDLQEHELFTDQLISSSFVTYTGL